MNLPSPSLPRKSCSTSLVCRAAPPLVVEALAVPMRGCHVVCRVACATFGGPIAMVRDEAKATLVRGASTTAPVVRNASAIEAASKPAASSFIVGDMAQYTRVACRV